LDSDGFGAAYAAWKRFGDKATYHSINYDYKEVPQFEVGSDVIILDFSFPRKILLEMQKRYASILVLDHHKTAQEQLRGLEFAHFNMDKSGAVLAWEWFHPDTEVPELLKYIQDRDLWRLELPYTKQINAAIHSYPHDFWQWEYLAKPETMPDLQHEGTALLRAMDQVTDTICKQAYLHYMPGGYLVPLVNASSHWTEAGHKLLKMYPDHPFVGLYYVTKDLKVYMALYSRNAEYPLGMDVGAYAKQYGGGGHKGAAGFVRDLKWMKDMEII
jgi:oligoribonuclease NrnB/cAMP/cGMP phosphodiesterase (DHH superfamily)